jgi:hypothetical protein
VEQVRKALSLDKNNFYLYGHSGGGAFALEYAGSPRHKQMKHGRYLYCANGSHLAMYDEQSCYFPGLIRFIKDVDAGR